MASRTIAYYATLLIWFALTSAASYSGISKATDLLGKIQGSWDIHSFLDGVSKKNGSTSFSFDWVVFDKWAENLQQGRLS
jgi:hypothetical protein